MLTKFKKFELSAKQQQSIVGGRGSETVLSIRKSDLSSYLPDRPLLPKEKPICGTPFPMADITLDGNPSTITRLPNLREKFN